MKKSIIMLIVFISGSLSFFGKDAISANQDALNLLVNFYSILAGILVAIITIIGDPSEILNSKNWREAFYKAELPSSQLIKTCCLFYTYLLTLLFIFISFLIPEQGYVFIKNIVEYTYVFLASLAILWSFNLPIMLVNYQRSKLNNAIKEKRDLDGIKP